VDAARRVVRDAGPHVMHRMVTIIMRVNRKSAKKAGIGDGRREDRIPA